MTTPFIVKYKPRSFDEFSMSSKLRTFLQVSVRTSNLFLLLVGDPGSGKTTLLDIIIDTYFGGHAMTPEQRSSHVLHVNSLKEQGIQFYRNDVKTFCQTKSAIPGRRKIVVLDDIDFINEQSQQVFRNCMDKFPTNALFLISCMNTQKVIESLQSRTTIVRLAPVGEDGLRDILTRIVDEEGLSITEDAKNHIISVSNGNARLLINYLEKIMILESHVDLPTMYGLCSNIDHQLLGDYMRLCRSPDLVGAVGKLMGLADKGYSVMDILDNLMMFVKNAPGLSEDERYELLPVLCKFVVIFHEIHEDNIELALLTNEIVQVLSSRS